LVLLTVVVCLPGCGKLLGISDPTPAGSSDGGGDPDGPSIDSSSPCVAAAMFQPEQSFSVGAMGTALAMGFLDRRPGGDIAIAVGDGIQILSGTNTGTGTFSLAAKITTTAAADGLGIGDFDNDGDDDFVVWDEGGTSIVAIRQNSTVTPSTYLAEQPLTGPFTGIQGALVGTIDGALVPDVLVNDASGARSYTSRVGTPGTFSREAIAIGNIAAGDTLVALRSINGGGDDAVFVGANGDVKVTLDGPTYAPAAVVASGARQSCVGIGKLDEDANIDLIVGTAAGGVIHRGGGNGSFAQASGTIAAVTGPSMQVIDLNGDGKDDLVLATRIVYQCAPAMAGGPGAFTQFEDIGSGGPVLVVDVTGDTKPDLLRIVGTELKVRVHQ
jgi:hypothetical protein